MTSIHTIVLVLGLHATGGVALADKLVKNAENTAAKVDKSEVKEIYTGKTKSWKSGTELELFLNAAGSAQLSWIAEQLGISSDLLFLKIKQEVFKGRMKDPARVTNSSDCVEHVKKSVGGVCAVDDATAKMLPAGVVVVPIH